MNLNRPLLIISIASLFLILLPAHPVHAATFTVTTTADSGAGSLRWAIGEANANPVPDTIEFDIPSSDPGCDAGSGVCTITPAGALPFLTDDGTTIDGYTQAGAAPATADTPAVILIQIDGALIGGNANGLGVTSGKNTIRGLSITGFTLNGIAIGYDTATLNHVVGNFLGLDPAGSAKGNAGGGLFIGLGARSNVVGGDAAADRNILSGNGWEGLGIHGVNTENNVVIGNFIGTDPTGTEAISNTLHGVRIYGGAAYNTIGGESAGERNLISGNAVDGVRIMGSDTDNNTVAGNYIGTTADGMHALGNGGMGVYLHDGPHDTVVIGNIISANEFGVYIAAAPDSGLETAANEVTANGIGLTADGRAPLGNAMDGVRISFAGRRNDLFHNTIAYNGQAGVAVDTPTAVDNVVWLNSIHDNGAKGIHLTNGANNGIEKPMINAVDLDALAVSGAACPDCSVQLFASPDALGEGFVWLGNAIAGPAGDFTVLVDELPFQYLTATATKTGDGTSEFSDVFRAPLPDLSTSNKTVMASSVRPRQALVYRIFLANGGAGPASATVTDTLPAEVTWDDQFTLTTGTLTWYEGENRLVWHSTVEAGASEQLVYRVIVKNGVPDGTVITNTATVDDGWDDVFDLDPTETLVAWERVYLPLALRN